MRLMKRIVADVRSPGLPNNYAETLINEKLINLQTRQDGTRNKVKILEVKEIVKDSGILVFIALYEDPDLDNLKTKEPQL